MCSRCRNRLRGRIRWGEATKPLNLLLVEDNAAVGRAIAKSLRAQGHAVTLAHTYDDARSTPGYYDVGIFDITLPDGDGIELCERLLRERRVGGAIFCSGSIDDLLIERAQETAPVVSKEASFWELSDAIVAAAPRPSSAPRGSSGPPKA
jgi:DNA-binding response OmpR family regulator